MWFDSLHPLCRTRKCFARRIYHSGTCSRCKIEAQTSPMMFWEKRDDVFVSQHCLCYLFGLKLSSMTSCVCHHRRRGVRIYCGRFQLVPDYFYYFSPPGQCYSMMCSATLVNSTQIWPSQVTSTQTEPHMAVNAANTAFPAPRVISLIVILIHGLI